MGRRYAKKRDVKSVYTHHTPVEDYFVQGLKLELLAGIAGRAYVAYENRFLQSFDCVTASTSRIRRDVTPRKLPVGIEMDTFRPVTDSQFASDEPTVGYSGRMTRKTRRRSSGWPTGCPTCGSNWWARDRSGTTSNGAPGNVRFRDFLPRENLPAFYSALDVFVTASTCDTLGLSTLEANACGTPVAADDPPFDRTIGPDNGTRFDHGDLDDMERAVDCLDGDRPTRAAVEGSPSSGR